MGIYFQNVDEALAAIKLSGEAYIILYAALVADDPQTRKRFPQEVQVFQVISFDIFALIILKTSHFETS